MTNYILYCDGGGTPTVPTYFSYQLYENNKPAGPVVNGIDSETIECHRFLTRFIPQNEIPSNCTLIDKKGRETNNLAEIICYYYAIKRVKEVSGELPIIVRQDSQLVVNFVNHKWQCKKPWLKSWLNAIDNIRWNDIKTEWVKRDVIVKILGH